MEVFATWLSSQTQNRLWLCLMWLAPSLSCLISQISEPIPVISLPNIQRFTMKIFWLSVRFIIPSVKHFCWRGVHYFSLVRRRLYRSDQYSSVEYGTTSTFCTCREWVGLLLAHLQLRFIFYHLSSTAWANNAALGVAGPIIVDGAKRDR